MFQRLFLSAILAGLLSGLTVTIIHHITTIPLIIEAEKYENGDVKKTAANNSTPPYLILVHGNAHSENSEGEANSWSPADGIERTMFTGLTTILTAIGFALLLTAGFALSNQSVTGKTGVMWGMGGFAALALAPAIGLPPELPGSAAAELVSRQIWWLLTATATLVGIGLLVFSKQWFIRAIAILLIMTPHAIGAPHPHGYSSAVPAEIQGHFVAVSLATNFILWAMLGWLSGRFYQKFA